MSTSQLRVAAVVRVSSGQQATPDKPSLEIQMGDIEQACAAKGFRIARRYVMEESATKGKIGGDPEREEFDKLLRDATGDAWDAVMVAHRSRWVRDPEDGYRAVRILNAAIPRKKFFFLGEQVAIHTATGLTLLGITNVLSKAESDQFAEGVRKSKWARAERGRWPCRFPWGLEQDARTLQWAKKKGCQALADRVFDMIVRRGLGMEEVAKRVGHGTAQTWHDRIPAMARTLTLTLRNFESNEERVFEFPDAPRFYTLRQLEQMERCWKARRTLSPQHRRGFVYSLRGKLKCSCGSIISGVSRTGKEKDRVYQHARALHKSAACVTSVPAKEIESRVFHELVWLVHQENLPELIRKGMAAADKRPDYATLLEDAERELAAIGKERRDLIALKARSAKLDDKAVRAFGDMLSELSTRQTRIEARVGALQQEKAEQEQKDERAEQAAAVLTYLGSRPMSWLEENKRILLDCFFGIGNAKGEQAGIYVTKVKLANGRCRYEPAYEFAVAVADAVAMFAGKMNPNNPSHRPFLRVFRQPKMHSANTSIST